MKRFSQFINEVMDIKSKPPETTWIHGHDKNSGISTSIASWKDPTGREIEHWFTKEPSGKVGVEFTRSDAVGNPTYNKTGTGRGKQSSIMTGIAQNFKQYMDNNPDVEHYKFSSGDDNRTKLYNRMVDRLAPQVGYVGTSTYDKDLNSTTYELKKAKPGESHTALSTPKVTTPRSVQTSTTNVKTGPSIKTGPSLRGGGGLPFNARDIGNHRPFRYRTKLPKIDPLGPDHYIDDFGPH